MPDEEAKSASKIPKINEDESVEFVDKGGFFSKVDLGIVKYHFEIGAGKENVKWK